MSTDGRLSTRSPSGSRTGSYRESGPSKVNDHAYQRRTSLENIDERDDNEYEEAVYNEDEALKQQPKPPRNEDPYISALKYRFPNRPKSDYVYTRPTGPSVPMAPSVPTVATAIPTAPSIPSGQNYNTTNKQTPPPSRFNPVTSDIKTFQLPQLKSVRPEDKNKYAQTFANRNEDNTMGKITPSRSDVHIGQPSSTRQNTPHRAEGQSQGRNTTYPGTTTNPHFQTCVQECLERERNRSGLPMHTTTHQDIPGTVSFDDYSALGPNYQTLTGTSHYFNSHSHSSPILLLNDLQNINVALARGGISLFPYERFYPASYYPSTPVMDTVNLLPSYRNPSPVQRYIGDVVSACRVADEDM